MKLYHGSIANIERTLKPHRAFDRWDYSPQVYLTDKRELALLYAINPISAYIKNTFNKDIHCSATSAHFCYLGKVPTLIEMYPDMFEKTYLHKKAYIYVCEITKDVAYKNDGNQYTIDHEITYTEKIEIEDVFAELVTLQEQGKLKLLPFENIDFEKTYFERERLIDGLRSRKEHWKTPEEKSFFEMMGKYFLIE